MVNRRVILVLSIAIAFVLQGLLLALAPRIRVLGVASAVPRGVMRTFQVRIQEHEMPPPVPRTAASALATRPGKIEDLLVWDDESLDPFDSVLGEIAEMPSLADRVASDNIAREHSLSPDAAVLESVDAKIIEIARDTARGDIEVVRRLVSPSSTRLIGDDEFPVLRRPEDPGVEPIRNVPPARSLLDEEGPQGPAGETGAEGEPEPERPPYEESVVLPEPLVEALPPLPEERIIARAPVIEEIAEESPYEFIDDLVDIKLDAFVPGSDERGFFRLRILPKEGGDIEVLSKDITFVIDASRSIVHQKLVRTAKAVREAVAGLREDDTFNIAVFRDSATLFNPAAVRATEENKNAAAEFLKAFESRGETDLYKAMRPVIETPAREGVPGIVMVITDGRPTTGVRDARTIINALTADRAAGKSIFTFGGGRTVNRYLLDLLAYRNKGASHVSSAISDISDDFPAFFGKVSDPILVNLKADYGQIDEDGIVPKEAPDFYKGRAVTVYGRFDPDEDKEFAMRLTGMAGARKKEVVFKANLAEAATGDEAIARAWAFERIYYLIGEVCRVGEEPELLGEIRALSMEYGIRTSYDD